MLNDALQARSLRKEVQSLRIAQVGEKTLQNRLSELQVSRSQAESMQHQVQSLQNQVHSLQNQLLSNVEKVHVISDDLFEKEFRGLVTMVKSLSRSFSVTKDTDMLEALNIRGLLLDVHGHHWDTRARKKCFVEAWIWSVLLEMVFKTPFTILREYSTATADLWSKLFGNRHPHEWPSPSGLCENWRRITVEHAIKAMSQATSSEGSVKMEHDVSDEGAQELESEDLRMQINVANEIGTRLVNLSTTVDFPLILNIVEAAYVLALKMSLQSSRLQITFPSAGDRFNGVQMTPISDADGEDREDGFVAFIVRPGLTKWGDAHDKHFDQRYDIVLSLVQLQAHHEEVVIKSEPT